MAGNKPDYHVVPRDDKWALQKEGADRATSLHNTQKEAQQAGRDLARKQGVEVVVHGKDGSIRNPNSYGNDPRSIKDTKP